MSASIKVMLYEHKTYSDGTHPITIQVIVNRKVLRKVIGRCKPDQWDKVSSRVKVRKHPNYASINRNISDKFNEIEYELLSIDNITVNQVKTILADEVVDSVPVPMLLEMFDARVAYNFELMKIGGYNHYRTTVSDLREWLKGYDMPISDIDKKWIERYESHLSTREVKPNKPNTIAKKLGAIKSIITEARKIDNSIKNPFDDFSIRKQKVLKEKLTAAELEIFKAYPVNTPRQEMCRDIFLLQIYLRGMRIGDLLQLKKSFIVGDRLKYQDDKTGKSFDLKLINAATTIIEKYSNSHKEDRIFPILKWKYNPAVSPSENEFKRRKAIESCTSQVNNVISMIGKKSGLNKTVRTHMARHTFAKMAFDKIKNTRITMGLVGHTDLKVHQNYIEDLLNSDELDDANDSVFE